MNQLLMMHMKNLYKSSRLPAGYIECEYIENTSNAYIDTGFKPDQNTKIECSYELISKSSYNTWQSIFGSRTSGYNNSLMVLINTSPFTHWIFYGNYSNGSNPQYMLDTSINGLGKHKIDVNKNNFIIDNKKFTRTISNIQNPYNLYVFTWNEAGTVTGYANMKLYSFKLWNNIQLVRDFIPCLEKATKLYGLYDKVSKQFFTSPNGVKFIGG